MNKKTIILTGCSSGMGKEMAIRLVREHDCTVIGIARNEKKMKALADELSFYDSKFIYRLFDVSVEENWIEFAKWLEAEKIQPDVLINNAGILPRFASFQNLSVEEVEQVMQINFYSCVYSIHALLPILLRSDSAAIINVDSSAALMSLAGTSVYSASKAALKSLTDSLREELRGKCYVSIVCPGFTQTDIFRNQRSGEGKKIIEMFSTPCNKMVDNILNGVRDKKQLMVFGKDAHVMGALGRILPVKGSQMLSAIIKFSRIPLFDDVFRQIQPDPIPPNEHVVTV